MFCIGGVILECEQWSEDSWRRSTEYCRHIKESWRGIAACDGELERLSMASVSSVGIDFRVACLH